MIESLLEISTHGFLIEHIFMFQNKMLFLFSHQYKYVSYTLLYLVQGSL